MNDEHYYKFQSEYQNIDLNTKQVRSSQLRNKSTTHFISYYFLIY
jgi:hypothetical protein